LHYWTHSTSQKHVQSAARIHLQIAQLGAIYCLFSGGELLSSSLAIYFYVLALKQNRKHKNTFLGGYKLWENQFTMLWGRQKMRMSAKNNIRIC